MSTPAAVRGAHALRTGARTLLTVWRGVLGEDAYDKYRAHVEAQRARGDVGHPLMTEREFWRDRTDRQDAHPQGRCC